MLTTITVDVGTTSVKLGLFDPEGVATVSTSHPTPTVRDADGEVYDLDLMAELIGGFIRGLDADRRAAVKRIAITGVGESGGLVLPDISLASPMILWHDQRGLPLLAGLDAADRSRVYRATGLPVSGNYGLSKIAWALRAAGDAGRGAQWLNISEYIAARFTGVRWSEYSLASRTLALDLTTAGWSQDVAGLLGVHAEVLPELRRAGDGVPMRAECARGFGLGDDVLVHVAGHDHMVGAVGAELAPGELLNSTGTTEGLLFLHDAPSLDGDAERAKLANGIHVTGPAVDDAFTLFASIPTGGSAFATLQSMLGVDAPTLAALCDELHADWVAGRVDLDRVPIVLPQFRGSPSPAKNPRARGAIARLATDTTRSELVFGAFVGMAWQFADVLELFRIQPDRVKVIGPASRNALWLQLKADLLGVPLSVSGHPEVVSRGAQQIASGGSGAWTDCDPVDVLPDPERHAALAAWAETQRPIWTHLKALPA
ncbi:L-fuculokinase [Schumannella sp. 10F1B-5-1]|uniref:FGGY-family carbohydrate kinase n=1 Tax=Schumannella sp. 10F1B-5-1 TaxID=2590780 RepID=UPI0015E87601|nr:FGGY family carbohydrate kinase [Schumannella sp. 10F1B-5-1]